jgi:peptidyl-prolyl cis-trans isomerase C
MKAKLKLVATAVLAVSLCTTALAQQAKPLAKVNGQSISSAVGNLLVDMQVAQGAPNNDALKKEVREELVRREVLAQEARKKGLDKKSEVQARIDLSRTDVLVGAYIEDFLRTHPISDADLRKEYDRQVGTMNKDQKEYKARHIVVNKEEDAKAIISKLQSGAKFEDFVKESTDPGTKDNGGDLGWSRPDQYVPPFAEALSKLDKGTFTPQPVKTDFGYHVIIVDDVRKVEPPPFDSVKQQLTQSLQQRQIQQQVQDLVSKAKVE